MSEVNGEPVLYIYSPIGEDMFGESVNPKQIADELKAYNGKDVTVRINSPGGSVTDGLAIYNLLNQYDGNVTCIVDGLAASMASVVAMAADDLQMPKGSFLMIHNPWIMSAGDSKQLRKDADVLENMRETLAKIYSFKTEKDIDEIKAIVLISFFLNK
jgi:ATP-dependent protease ClpP protease subunit